MEKMTARAGLIMGALTGVSIGRTCFKQMWGLRKMDLAFALDDVSLSTLARKSFGNEHDVTVGHF
jgi:hypothetical protein